MVSIDSLRFIIPEGVLFVFALVVLFLGLIRVSKNILGLLSFLGVLISALFLLFYVGTSHVAFFSNMLCNDGMAFLFKIIILGITAAIVLLSMSFKAIDDDAGEYYFFLLVIAISMMVAVSAKNLMLIYLAVESVSVVSYVLSGFLKQEKGSSEAGLKYFLFGALSTGIMLYGISFIYGVFGTLDITGISTSLEQGFSKSIILSIACVFLLVGLGFKCGLAPFHMWVADVYQGSATPVAALFSIGPKAVGFVLLIRLCFDEFFMLLPQWALIASCLAVFSMTIGNMLAITQTNIKRILAYSSIAQAGCIAVGLAVGTPKAFEASIFYLIVYCFMNLLAFCCVIIHSRSGLSDEINEYAGLYKTDPITSFGMALALVSLAGIPPLAGFWAKFLVLFAAIENHSYFLAVLLILNSLIAAYYYLRIIRVMYFKEPKTHEVRAKSVGLQVVLILGTAGIFIFGIFPDLILNWLLFLK